MVFLKWFNFDLSKRVFAVSAIMTASIVVAVVSLVIYLLRNDKLVYAYDLLDLKAEAISLSVRDFLNKEMQTSQILDASLIDLERANFGIQKLPAVGQLFVFPQGQGQRALLLARDPSGLFRKKIVDLSDRQVFGSGTLVGAWSTTLGEPLWVKNTPISEVTDDFRSRSDVKTYLSSPVPRGVLTFGWGTGGMVTSFREVPDTNSVVFVSMGLWEILAPTNELMLRIAGFSFAALIIFLFIKFVLFGNVLRPYERIESICAELSDGRTRNNYAYEGNDDVRGIFSRLEVIGAAIDERENSIQKLRNHTVMLSATANAMVRESSHIGVGTLGANAILGSLPFNPRCEAYLYFVDRRMRSAWGAHSFKLVQNGRLLETPLTFTDRPLLVRESLSKIGESTEPLLTPEGVLVLPLVVDETISGYLCFRGFNEKSLTHDDTVFVAGIASLLSSHFERVFLREKAG